MAGFYGMAEKQASAKNVECHDNMRWLYLKQTRAAYQLECTTVSVAVARTTTQPDMRIARSTTHNTIINPKPYPALFLRVWRNRASRCFTLKFRNNHFIGLGLFDCWPIGDDHAGNFFSPLQILNSPETLDFSIRPDSSASALMHPAKLDNQLKSEFEFALPLGKRRIEIDLPPLPSAIQTSSF